MAQRRSGPSEEEPWWDPADQALVERPVLDRTALGKGWRPVAMVNNAERLDPLGDDPDSEAVRGARARRRLTALDEGRAWRHQRSGSLAVVRAEAFSSPDDAEHRAAWRTHGASSLEATWRSRWGERSVTPGWIEARAVSATTMVTDVAVAECIDWFGVEDHTDPSGGGGVQQYEHVTLWLGRVHVVVTVRHDLGASAGSVAAGRAATAVANRWFGALT